MLKPKLTPSAGKPAKKLHPIRSKRTEDSPPENASSNGHQNGHALAAPSNGETSNGKPPLLAANIKELVRHAQKLVYLTYHSYNVPLPVSMVIPRVVVDMC